MMWVYRPLAKNGICHSFLASAEATPLFELHATHVVRKVGATRPWAANQGHLYICVLVQGITAAQ